MTNEENAVVIKWLGHAAFHIYSDSLSILMDPWLKNPKAGFSA